MSEPRIETRYRLEVSGLFQRWDDKDLNRLTEPRPFEGVAVPDDWGISVFETGPGHTVPDRMWDETFDPTGYKGFGPWWFKVTSHRWIAVTTMTMVHEEESPWISAGQ